MEKKEIRKKGVIIKLNGIPIRLVNPDLDGDGIVGQVENMTQYKDKGVQEIIQTTETGEALEQLNSDEITDSKMTSIDMRGRLHHAEVSSILALDALVSLGVCPSALLSFTRRKKRLSVSIDGKGRGEIVNLVTGKQELEKQKFTDKFAGMFKKKEQI